MPKICCPFPNRQSNYLKASQKKKKKKNPPEEEKELTDLCPQFILFEFLHPIHRNSGFSTSSCPEAKRQTNSVLPHKTSWPGAWIGSGLVKEEGDAHSL